MKSQKIKSHNHWVGESQTGEELYHRSPPTGVKVLSPTSGFQTRGFGNGRRNPRETDFEGQQDLITGLWQGWGKQRLHSWRAHTKLCAHQEPGRRRNDPIGDWTRPTCWCWGVSCRGGGQLKLTTGTRTLAAEVLGSTPWREPAQSLPLAPQEACRLQCRVASGQQPTGREPSPTHQQTSGLKFYWALLTRATQSSTHNQSLPSGSLQSLLNRLIHQRADGRSKKNYSPAACRTKTTITER